MNLKYVALVGALIFGLYTVKPAAAAAFNEETTITFTAPFELPGKALPAGTYVFRLWDEPSAQEVVQVFSKNKRHFYGSFIAHFDYSLKPADRTVLRFNESPAGSPDAIRVWFYRGERYGRQFVYGKENNRP